MNGTSRIVRRANKQPKLASGELLYLNVARLKAGAHYTGNTGKREKYLSEKTPVQLSVTGFADNPSSVYFL
jgi:hypothetical protein